MNANLLYVVAPKNLRLWRDCRQWKLVQNRLRKVQVVEHWLNELCEELSERLQSDLNQNKRIAHTLTLHARAYKSNDSDSHKKFPSKSCPLRYGTAKIQEDALILFQAGLREYLSSYNRDNQYNGWRIAGLSVLASKIVAIPSGTSSIMKYFHGQDQFHSSAKQSDEKIMQEVAPLSPSGSESYSMSSSTEPQLECHGEETRFKYGIPSLDQQEDKRILCKDEETCVVMRLGHNQDPSCSSSKQAQDGFTRETSPLSPSGADDCLVLKQAEPQLVFHGEETRIKYPVDGVRQQEQKKKTSKEKGTSSILRFFQSHNRQEHVNTLQETKASSSLGSQSMANSCSELIKGELPQETLLVERGTFTCTNNLSQNERRMDSWSYKIDEIDQAVVNELPQEIQEEVQAWLRPHKRANTVKRGSSIAHYFLPNKNA